MAYHTTTLGGTTLADPRYDEEGCKVEVRGQGAFADMADGSIVFDSTGGHRFAWGLRWVYLTEGEKDIIEAEAVRDEQLVFSPPYTSGTFDVFVVPGSYAVETIWFGNEGQYRFHVSLELEEVSV